MLPISTQPKKIEKIADGWAAFGNGWAVHALTKELVLQVYEERVKFYKNLLKRLEVTVGQVNEKQRKKNHQ